MEFSAVFGDKLDVKTGVTGGVPDNKTVEHPQFLDNFASFSAATRSLGTNVSANNQ